MQSKNNCMITWNYFEVCNPNKTEAFENMCRWLFNIAFFEGDAILHSDPNNPGVEIVPIVHTQSGKKISFQAKYFEKIDYDKIMDSAKTAIKYYANELDVIYLYCNKDVNTANQKYQDIEKMLDDENIKLVPITNQSILEQVMANELVALHYFNNVSFDSKWLEEKLSLSLETLGPRYNQDFNAPTKAQESFDFFLCNANAAEHINDAKAEVIDVLKKQKKDHREYIDIISKYINVIESLEDVSDNNILECKKWEHIIKTKSEQTLCDIDSLIKIKEKEYEKALTDNDYERREKLYKSIELLGFLKRVPESLLDSKRNIDLIDHQLIVLKGEAGAGKSQLLAVAAKELVDSGRAAILLLGNDFLSNTPITRQTGDILGVELTLDLILQKLEAIGAQANCYSYLFIDALNESVYKDVWKTGVLNLALSIKKYPHVKVALSVRNGYEKLVFNDAFYERITSREIGLINHSSLRGASIDTTFAFLDFYGIPFLPSYFLQGEMKNALFLKLFCELYSGEDFNVISLFNKLIRKADEEAKLATGIDFDGQILIDLINEIVEFRLNKGTLPITKSELLSFNFWQNYGFTVNKLNYINALVKSGLFIAVCNDGVESYYLGYNLLEDFVCANKIVKDSPDKEQFCAYIKQTILNVEDGRITNYSNIDIAVISCVLYEEKYKINCFEELAISIADEYDKSEIIYRYLNSFLWREKDLINATDFRNLVNKYSVEPERVFQILIDNSAKEDHPLNALFLHEILFYKELVERDALWTIVINNLSYDDESVYQLIKYFEKGNKLNGLSEENVELLLTLFGWFLTTSNRFIRDKTSKAMIELLKDYFHIGKNLLKRFENVNDPYIIERLYGIVLGACLKRSDNNKETFKSLVKYIYSAIFDKEKVYPDILLRDYARLIIERWRYEYPDDCDFIVMQKITPPYFSDDIPVVGRETYYIDEPGNHGFNSIVRSMYIDHAECPGLYGDFGRYVFQSAVSSFNEVDIVNVYHYAMQFIRDELKYSEDLLGEYDSYSIHGNYYRHDTKKMERIGKKYQWITLHNILARLSDVYQIKNWDLGVQPFEGPWEPYVRDFDPTLNTNNLQNGDIQSLIYPVSKYEFLAQDPIPSLKEIRSWKDNIPESFLDIPLELVAEDESNNKWIALHLFDDVEKPGCETEEYVGISKNTQKIWHIANAFFVNENDFDYVEKYILSEKVDFESFYYTNSIYQLFNREYSWAPGCKSIIRDLWNECEIELGEYRIVKETYERPDYTNATYDDEGNIEIPVITEEFERKIPEESKNIEIMPAVINFLWEGQYDASQDETTSFWIPYIDLIDKMKLEQKTHDSYYYTNDGLLACFNNQKGNFYISQEVLDTYLAHNNLKLCWTCRGEKQYFVSDIQQEWSSWKGFYYYKNGQAQGEIVIQED